MKTAALTILSAILFLPCAAFAQMQTLGAKDTWAAAKFSAEETKQIIAGAEQSAFDTPDSWETELRVRRMDLGGTQGIIAQGTKLLCGGTGNCEIFVFRKAEGKWVSLFKADAPIADGFQLGPPSTRGIKDLTISVNSSAAASKNTVYVFDGEVYREVKKKGIVSPHDS